MSSPIHILMVVNTYAPDDPRVIFSAASLVKMGYKVKLIGSARQKGDENISTQQYYQGVNIQLTPHVTSFQPLSLFRSIWCLLLGKTPPHIRSNLAHTNFLSLAFLTLWIIRIGITSKIDVIHCHDLSPLLGCRLVAAIKRKKLIYDIHENVPTMYSGRKGQIMTWLERQLVPQVDHVISAGKRLAQAMTERGAKNVTHIGNWKHLSDYDISEIALSEVRQRWDIPDDAFIISFIGTLDENRELPPLLEVLSESPQIVLLIGGRGSYQDLVMDYAEKYHNIIWLGWVAVEEVPAYTLLADVLYYCRSENMKGGSYDLAPAPNKLYEAFVAGRPIIARRGVGEIGEILEEIPAGILVDEASPTTIKEAINLLNDPQNYAKLRESAHRAGEQYNWAYAEKLLQDIYSKLAT